MSLRDAWARAREFHGLRGFGLTVAFKRGDVDRSCAVLRSDTDALAGVECLALDGQMGFGMEKELTCSWLVCCALSTSTYL